MVKGMFARLKLTCYFTALILWRKLTFMHVLVIKKRFSHKHWQIYEYLGMRELTRLFAAIYPWADLSGKGKNGFYEASRSKSRLRCVFHFSRAAHLLRWSSCTSGCSQSLWSRKTLRHQAQPVGSSSAPAWWCWRFAGAGPTALGCPARQKKR